MRRTGERWGRSAWECGMFRMLANWRLLAELSQECLHSRKCGAICAFACCGGRYAAFGGCYEERYVRDDAGNGREYGHVLISFGI